MEKGSLELFLGPGAESERDAVLAEHGRLGLLAEAITIQQVREMEPGLGSAAVAAAWLPDEAIVDPRLLMDAAVSAARARGVHIRANCAVTALLQARGRCTGVMTGEGPLLASHVVIAAGSFSSQMPPEIAGYVPTRPVRGQIVALRPLESSSEPAVGHVLRSANGYLVPQADGRILAGSTLEDAGFEKRVTVAGVQKILRGAVELAPGLERAEIVETWAGLRPGTGDKLPILGPTDVESLIIATGHYRNGILLAPVTAKMVAHWVLGLPVKRDMSPFSPMRFGPGARAPRSNAPARPATV